MRVKQSKTKNQPKRHILNTRKKRNTMKKLKITTGGEPQEPINEEDINSFISVISEHQLYTSNFDALCRKTPSLLKFFKKPTDCDIMFLELLSKRKNVSEIIKLTTDPKRFDGKIKIDDVTNFLENNSCEVQQTENMSPILKENIEEIVEEVFNKQFSSDAIKSFLTFNHQEGTENSSHLNKKDSNKSGTY